MKRLLATCCALALLLSPVVGKTAAISPSVIDLSASAGQIIGSTFVILNTGASEQTYFLDRLGFEPGQEDGTPVFASPGERTSEFLSWIDFPVTEVSVPARSKVDVPFQIIVPDDVAAGSYWGAVSVSTAPTEVVATNGATIEARTAILVFLTIGGETVQKLELLDLAIDQSELSLPFGTFRYRVQNQGNVYLIPTGTITLKGLLGQTVAVVDANESDGRVLPGSTRTFEVPVGQDGMSWLERAGFQLKHLAVGPMTAELELQYGDGEIIQTTQSFRVIPVELMIIVGVLLLLLVLLLKLLPKRS